MAGEVPGWKDFKVHGRSHRAASIFWVRWVQRTLVRPPGQATGGRESGALLRHRGHAAPLTAARGVQGRTWSGSDSCCR